MSRVGMTRASFWAHKRGYARVLDVRYGQFTPVGAARIEATGNFRVAWALAMYALRHSPVTGPIDWPTVIPTHVTVISRYRYRFQVKYRRLESLGPAEKEGQSVA